MKFPAFTAINLKNDSHSIDLVDLALSQITPDPHQPRKHFDQEAQEELTASVKQYGILQPIIVKPEGEGKYQIIAGERRWRAANVAALVMIPAIIQSNNVQDNMAIALIENIQREQLNPIELAQAFSHLHQQHGLSHARIATIVGKRRTTVTNLLRLLNLPGFIRNLLEDGALEMGHARSLLTLPEAQQRVIAEQIIDKHLSVRATEKVVQEKRRASVENPYSKSVDHWQKSLAEKLSTKVAVNINEQGVGRLVIHFSSASELDSLVGAIERVVEDDK